MWSSWKFSSAVLSQGSSKLGQFTCADGPLSVKVTNPVYKDPGFATGINHTMQSANVKLVFFIHADTCSVLTSSSTPWPTILPSPAVGRLHCKEQTQMLFCLEWSWIPSKSTGSRKLRVHLLHLTHGLATVPCRVLLFMSLWLSGWLFATAQIKIRVDRSNKTQYKKPGGFHATVKSETIDHPKSSRDI